MRGDTCLGERCLGYTGGEEEGAEVEALLRESDASTINKEDGRDCERVGSAASV